MTPINFDNKSSNGKREVNSPHVQPQPKILEYEPNVAPPNTGDTPGPEPGGRRSLLGAIAAAFPGLATIFAFSGGVVAAPSTGPTSAITMDIPATSKDIANKLVSTVHGATLKEQSQAQGILHQAIDAVWHEFESLPKEIIHDAFKDVVKVGLGSAVITYLILPMRRALGHHADNSVVSEIDRRLGILESKLKAEPDAQINDLNVSIWIDISKEDAVPLLRAMKFVRKDGQWIPDTNR